MVSIFKSLFLSLRKRCSKRRAAQARAFCNKPNRHSSAEQLAAQTSNSRKGSPRGRSPIETEPTDIAMSLTTHADADSYVSTGEALREEVGNAPTQPLTGAQAELNVSGDMLNDTGLCERTFTAGREVDRLKCEEITLDSQLRREELSRMGVNVTDFQEEEDDRRDHEEDMATKCARLKAQKDLALFYTAEMQSKHGRRGERANS